MMYKDCIMKNAMVFRCALDPVSVSGLIDHCCCACPDSLSAGTFQ